MASGKRFQVTRREFAQAIGASAVVASPIGAFGDSASKLHLEVAAKAADLAQGNPSKLRLLLPEGCLGNVRPLLEKFRILAGITIDPIVATVDEINTQLIIDSLAGAASYDLALPATFSIPDLVDAGAIRSLNSYSAKHEPKGFRDETLYAIGDTFDETIYGFQTDGDVYTMFYNNDWISDPDLSARYSDRFGISLGVPATWPELDQQMAFFHDPESGRYGGALFRVPGYLAWEWWVRFHAKGMWPLSSEMVPQIDLAEGVESLEEMIAASAFLHPRSNVAGLFENWENYARGDTYCNIGWGGSQKYLNSTKSNVRGRMLYGPTPGGTVDGKLLRTPYFNWGWNYVVTSSSRVPEIAYLFGLFAVSADMSVTAVRETDGFFDPFRPEHYEDPEVIDAYGAEFLAVHKDSMLNAIPDLYLAQQGEYMQALNLWIGRAIIGDVHPKAAMKRVVESWNLTTDSAGRSEQKARWRNLRQKYPPSVRAMLKDYRI